MNVGGSRLENRTFPGPSAKGPEKRSPMIQMYSVSKTYGTTPALVDVSIEIKRGDFAFIIGPSGAGKTTLLKLIFCAEKADSGQILVNGRNIGAIRPSTVPYLRRNVGFVFQDFKLLNKKTVFENIAFCQRAIGVPNKEIKKRVWQVLKAVGLNHKLDMLPVQLSGGEQQKVAIARALVNEPALLLADEPTGNLDPDTSEEIMALFKHVNLRGTTLLLATHDKSLVGRTNSKVIELYRGKVVKVHNE